MKAATEAWLLLNCFSGRSDETLNENDILIFLGVYHFLVKEHKS